MQTLGGIGGQHFISKLHLENGSQPHAVLWTEPVSRWLEPAVDSAGQQHWTTHLSVPLCGVERQRAPGYAESGGDSVHAQ